jgi:hypothetical protein
MDDKEKRIILTALETIESSLNRIEAKIEVAEAVLGKIRPDLLVEYEKTVRLALENRLSSSAQMLQEIRKTLLKSIP